MNSVIASRSFNPNSEIWNRPRPRRRARPRYIGIPLTAKRPMEPIFSVSLIAKRSGILEDEDDSSNSVFRFNLPDAVVKMQKLELSLTR
jgi:hypothetical protein